MTEEGLAALTVCTAANEHDLMSADSMWLLP